MNTIVWQLRTDWPAISPNFDRSLYGLRSPSSYSMSHLVAHGKIMPQSFCVIVFHTRNWICDLDFLKRELLALSRKGDDWGTEKKGHIISVSLYVGKKWRKNNAAVNNMYFFSSFWLILFFKFILSSHSHKCLATVDYLKVS